MQETNRDVLLTDLCAICHINLIKYTCPRCGVHTCSLPCVKRHKSWAQCSGVRDPAAYRKRTDLATPASVDQDFNFITSVERSLKRADDLTLSKGIGLLPSGLKRDRRTKFDSALGERGIRLIKAPPGLSRNKQNKSHWAGGGKGLVWTIEWIFHDGRRKNTNVVESITVEGAFSIAFERNAVNRKKRKRSDAETRTAPAPGPYPLSTLEKAIDRNNEEFLERAQDRVQHGESGQSDLVLSQTKSSINNALDTEQTKARHQEAAHPPQDLQYYLFKPSTISKVKCLIPVAAESKLVDVLRNRTLLEFPTFYVREEAPDTLPAPLMTEAKYNELYGTSVSIDLPAYAPNDEVEEGEVIDLQDIDEKKVLEVLQKDLNG